jgi:hypothetical protein
LGNGFDANGGADASQKVSVYLQIHIALQNIFAGYLDYRPAVPIIRIVQRSKTGFRGDKADVAQAVKQQPVTTEDLIC